MFMSAIRTGGADIQALSDQLDEKLGLCAYVGNDPINFVDPLGLEEEEEEIVVIGSRCGGIWIGDHCVDSISFDLGSLARPTFDWYVPIALGGIVEFVEEGKEAFCKAPPLQVTVGVDAYVGAGASANVGASFDFRTGQVRGVVSGGAGYGYGGGFGVGFGPGNRSGVQTSTNYTLAGGGGSVTLATPINSSRFSSGTVGVSATPNLKFGPRAGGWVNGSVDYTSESSRKLYDAC